MSGQPAKHTKPPIDAKRQLLPELLARLDRSWTVPDWVPSERPVDELVATILSQNTSDTNTHRAFTALRDAFSTWADVVNAPVQDVETAIRPGGLARQKAPRIQQALDQILTPDDPDPNQTLLRQLQEMQADQAMSWLTGMRGVGPKTAACVLLFAAGKSVVPVDTHVYRVSQRIGLIDSGVDANRAHDELLGIVPPAESFRFHMHLIHHGRAICKARTPRCHHCMLTDLCQYWKESNAGA